jgi:ribonuclease P protein component
VHTFPRAERDGEPPRLGLSVSRRVGGAVERNRVKRALRERFAEIVPLLPTGLDVVVVARPGCVRYLDEHGSAALGERLRDLALRSAAPGAEVPGA